MATLPTEPQPPTPEVISPFRLFLRRARIVLIVLFVCWHLFFLLFRNIFDLWYDEIVTNGLKKQKWWDTPVLVMQQAYPNDPRAVDLTPGTLMSMVDMVTWRYGNYFGLEQGWSMFSPPIARRAPFVAAEVELSDGTTEKLLSPNEFPMSGYFRWDGWRQRKLEDYIVFEDAESIPNKSDPQLFVAYIRWTVRRWQAAHPADPREVVRVRLIKRTWTMPKPEEPPTALTLEETPIATFLPDGTLQP